MSWFEKLMPSRIRTEASSKRAVPEGIWAKCPGCSAILYRAELERNLEVCPKCGHHNRLGARRRLDAFLDPEPREEIAPDMESVDPSSSRTSRSTRSASPPPRSRPARRRPWSSCAGGSKAWT
jgi:acetyl-CoA carboxylase beta subunit